MLRTRACFLRINPLRTAVPFSEQTKNQSGLSQIWDWSSEGIKTVFCIVKRTAAKLLLVRAIRAIEHFYLAKAKRYTAVLHAAVLPQLHVAVPPLPFNTNI